MDNNLWWVICPSCGNISDADLLTGDNSTWNKLTSVELVKKELSDCECDECLKKIDINDCLILTEEELNKRYDELNKKYDYDSKDFSEYTN